MATNASWALGVPAIKHNPDFELEDTTSAKIVLDNNGLRGSSLPRIISNSATLQRVLRLVHLVAPTDTTVLIQGETDATRPRIHPLLLHSEDWSSRVLATAVVGNGRSPACGEERT